ncbi:hypothetical protein FH972_023919 [Carpinus fangiana]|uniref:Uncharacterized protein n=1 Tax=Carpinus fangiana TaxID=176857 RepID=A0A5N6KWW9_9ROSI|nr:hypothetical protein FH972_023919 [Carpinus fangiana]
MRWRPNTSGGKGALENRFVRAGEMEERNAAPAFLGVTISQSLISPHRFLALIMCRSQSQNPSRENPWSKEVIIADHRDSLDVIISHLSGYQRSVHLQLRH